MTTPIEQATQGFRPQPMRPPMQVRRANGQVVSEESVLNIWTDRRSQAKRDRARYEPDWYLCQSYVANKQWVGWSAKRGGRVLSLLDDPREKDREHHTENVLTSYLWTAVGQLVTGDTFLPPVQFRNKDIRSEQYANEARKALKFAWQEDLDADEVIEDSLLGAATFGTSGARLLFQRGLGDAYGDFPIHPGTGQMVTGPERFGLVAQAQEAGEQLGYEKLQGQMQLESLDPFHMLVPPGVQHMKNFPWIIIECPYPVDQLRAWFPDRADEIQPQSLSAIDQIGLREIRDADNSSAAGAGQLKDHALLATGYEMPTRDFQSGRVVMWTQNVLLDESPQLSFNVNGKWMAGIVPFHYRKVKGRFWGLGIVEPALGVQRQRNRSRSQHIEWKDRNLGRVYAPKDAITVNNRPRGKIMELIEVHPAYIGKIQETQPGTLPNVEQEVQMLDQAMQFVTGFGPLSALSTPTAGLHAYAALALSKQADDQRNGPILRSARRGIKQLAGLILVGMRQYWPPGKEIALGGSGPDDEFASFVFNAAELPVQFYVELNPGAPLPADPAAQVQLAFDVFDRDTARGGTGGTSLEWLLRSIQAGKLEALDHTANDLQRDKAEYENMLMASGQIPPVAEYDNDQMHVQIHREAQALRSMQPGQEQIVAIVEQHIAEHEQAAMMKAQAATVPNLQGGLGGLGGMTPGGPAPAAPGLTGAAPATQ